MNDIIHGQWEDHTKHIDSGTVDLVFTDPPYQSTPCHWDRRPRWKDFMIEMARVCGDDGQMWIFTRPPWCCDVLESAAVSGWRYVQEIIWEKQNAGGCTAGTFRKIHENIWHFKRLHAKTFNLDAVRIPKTTKGDKSVSKRNASPTQFFGTDDSSYVDDGLRMPKSVIHCRNVHRTKEATGHPTQKPVALLIPLILYSTNLGDVILDPFSGSGSTLTAAEMTGRSWIGIESDDIWYNRSLKRLSDTKPSVLYSLQGKTDISGE